MKINFKQPKYVLPLAILPFLCLFFYVWQSNAVKKTTIVTAQDSLNPNVGSVSGNVRKKQLADKLDAYRSTYKEATGITAVGAIPNENTSNPGFNNDYTGEQRRRIDSLQRAMKLKQNDAVHMSRPLHAVNDDAAIAAALNTAQLQRPSQPQSTTQQPDPMDVFRQQMSIMDSVSKQNDPQWREDQRKKAAVESAAAALKEKVKLKVTKTEPPSDDFNTVRPRQEQSFITAVIDENVTGYAGSRIRLRLLESISAGGQQVPKGSYLYAQISGFSEQRVTLSVTSILHSGKILPVKLNVYDLDGMAGLYVPRSAFREFTKDLGSNSIQGVTIDGGTGNNQFMMSSLDKLFQSTSSAIASAIRKNKASLKFNSFIYLIDPDELQKTQKTY